MLSDKQLCHQYHTKQQQSSHPNPQKDKFECEETEHSLRNTISETMTIKIGDDTISTPPPAGDIDAVAVAVEVIPTATDETTGMGDPENPEQAYTLTIYRKTKNYQSCHPFPVTKNGQDVGKLLNGGDPIIIQGTVGDTIEVYVGQCKSSCNTFSMTVQKPGNLHARVKQAGDVMAYLLFTVGIICLLASAAGFIIGVVPLLLVLIFSSSAIIKYNRAGWKEATRCETDNPDFDNGSLLITSNKGCCSC